MADLPDTTLPSEAFLQALYHGLLQREPDADGIGDRLAFYGPTMTLAAGVRLLGEFVKGWEFRRLHPPALAEIYNADPQGPTYTRIISLGTFCMPAWCFRRYGLRRQAFPFDWIFSTVDMVIHCLDDDFATLLDATHYRPNAPADRISPEVDFADHAIYSERYRLASLFNHYDPTEAAQHAYLQRCVARFRAVLAGGERTLFVCMLKSDEPAEQAAPFRRLAAAVARTCPNGALLTIVIAPPRPGTGVFGTVKLDQLGPHRLIVLRALSHLAGLEFGDPFDDLMMRRLLAEYRVELAG